MYELHSTDYKAVSRCMAVLPWLHSRDVRREKQPENKEQIKDRITRIDDVIDICPVLGWQICTVPKRRFGNTIITVTIAFSFHSTAEAEFPLRLGGGGRRVSEHCLGAAQRPHGLIPGSGTASNPQQPPLQEPRAHPRDHSTKLAAVTTQIRTAFEKSKKSSTIESSCATAGGRPLHLATPIIPPVRKYPTNPHPHPHPRVRRPLPVPPSSPIRVLSLRARPT